MTSKLQFALNHISVPKADCRTFIDLASSLGCVGVELRNDFVSKNLATAVFFDGEQPSVIGEHARERGVRLLGLSEAYGFNRWAPEMADRIRLLIAQAKESGAESISLIPSNDGARETDAKRLSDLRKTLSMILPMLQDAGIVALIEPLGFTTSSLRRKREVIDAITDLGGSGSFKLVHDTFHHFIANETEFFPEWTGVVHISGVIDPSPAVSEMQDGHRVLVNDQDRLQNIEQIRTLSSMGYEGPYSYEAFASSVQKDAAIAERLSTSMRFITSALD
jgi:2-keto-myo-inositol isomerase